MLSYFCFFYGGPEGSNANKKKTLIKKENANKKRKRK